MIRRKFMKYAPKEHDDEKVKATLKKHNVPVFEGKDPTKFAQYGNIAKDLAKQNKQTITTPEGGQMASADKTFKWQQEALYGGGTGRPATSADQRNPYAMYRPSGNPYAQAAPPAGNPYAGGNVGGNPYAGGPLPTSASANVPPTSSPEKPSKSSFGKSFGKSFKKKSKDTKDYGQADFDTPYAPATVPASASMPPAASMGAPAMGQNNYNSSFGRDSYGNSGYKGAYTPLDYANKNPDYDELNESEFDPPTSSGASTFGVPTGGYAASSGASTFGVPTGGYASSTYGDKAGSSGASTYGDSKLASSSASTYGVSSYGSSTYGSGISGTGYGGTGYGGAGYGSGYGVAGYGGTSTRPAGPSGHVIYDHAEEAESNDTLGALGGGAPLRRTRSNQSTRTTATTGTTAVRDELFGSAPRRMDPGAAEFDELNRTATELDGDDELMQTSANLERPVYAPKAGIPGMVDNNDEKEDELNQLPSELAHQSAGVGGEAFDFDKQQQSYTFEDSEDEDVNIVKQEIRQTKQESVESTRRAIEIARQAELSGVNALGMLGNQGERLGGAAKTVQLGHVQARTGDRNADELIRLNRSIFIPNISNPFNSRRRNQLIEQRLKGEKAMDDLEAQQLELSQREADRRIAEGLNAAGNGYSETAMRARQRANRDNPERKMYQFEADSDDDALEDEIEDNLDEIGLASKRLHGLSLKIQEELDDQNHRIDHMGDRVDTLDVNLLKSTAKMSSIL